MVDNPERIGWTLQRVPGYDAATGGSLEPDRERYSFALTNLTKEEAALAVRFLGELQRSRV